MPMPGTEIKSKPWAQQTINLKTIEGLDKAYPFVLWEEKK